MADGDRAPFVRCLLQTGQRGCYDSRGKAIPCPGSGQDAAFRIALPAGADFEALRPAYWSSTTSLFEPDWAWVLYLDAGAVGVGQKKGAHFHVWAVR